MTQPGKERLIFLTGDPAQVPTEWMGLLEQEVWPPLRYDAWPQLLDDPLPDIVYVFPDMADRRTPRDPQFATALSATRWVAVAPEPDFASVHQTVADGYHEVLDLNGAAALCVGPVLRLRELRGASEEAQRLLEESLGAYEELRWHDRVRELLRVLEFNELAPRLVREFAGALGESTGALWRPSADPADAGRLELVADVGMGLSDGERTMMLHALPQVAELLKDQPQQLVWRDQPTVFAPLIEAGMLLALVEVPRTTGRLALLHREDSRVRMLMDWTGIAVQNSLEAEQMRRVLRTRFGDSFPASAFRQHVEKALLQATRYQRPVSLVGLEFRGEGEARRRVFQLVLELLRDADIFEEPQGGRAHVFLPETGYLGAAQFLRRLHREVTQKHGQPTALKLHGVIASYPHHGSDVEALFATTNEALDRGREVSEAVGEIRGGYVADYPYALARHARGAFTDPNAWADMAFHLIQEATVLDAAESRMVLHLGSFAESARTFQSLFEFPGRWDRILVTAALDEKSPIPDNHLIRMVRDPAMLRTFLALLERPRGSVAVWCRHGKDGWQGGLANEPLVIRAAINRFEDQYMLHQRWVSS